MADTTLTMKLKVQDDGSILLDKFSGKLAEIPKHVDSMNRSISLIKWDSIANLSEQAFRAGERIYNMARSVASGTMEIGRMAQISGLSTDAFQKFAYAAKMSDVENESLAVGMKRLSKNMEETSQGSGDAKKWFDVMGISVQDLNTRGLKPLDQMMGELADKFSGWEDGTRKIAIAVALFGRAGEALIPMLNKGKSGLTEFYKEAERLGIVLSPDMVRKGEEAENAFKRFEAQLKTFKLSLSPVVSELTKYLGVVTDIVNKGKELAFPTMPKGPAYELTGQEKKLFSLFGIDIMQRKELKRTPELWEIFGGESIFGKGKAGLPPELPKEYPIMKGMDDLWKSFKGGEGIIKIIQGDMVEMIPVIKDYESWWDKINDDLDELGLKMKMVTPEGAQWGAEEPGLKRGMMTIGGQEWKINDYEELQRTLEETKNLIADFGWEDYAAGLDAATEGTRKLSQMTLQNTTAAEEMMKWNQFIEEIGQNISSIWAQDIGKMLKGTESFGEAFKNIWADMADYAISQILRMAANYALFENIKGEYKSGFGLLGWLGGLFGGGGFYAGESFAYQHGGIVPGWKPIEAFQGGGMISRPTLGLIGEGGPEAVIPLKGGKIPIEGGGGGQNTYIFISAIDTQSFDQALKRCSGRVVRIVENNMGHNGPLRAR